jgi:hypothetical protein
MPNSIDIAAIVATAVEDRRLCLLAGVPVLDANEWIATELSALIRRLEQRGLDTRTASEAAFTLYDELSPPEGEQVH